MVEGRPSVAGDVLGEALERRVQEARQEYEVALDRVRKLGRHTNGRDGAGPAAAITEQEARRMEAAATRRYAAALKALSDHVLGREARDCP